MKINAAHRFQRQGRDVPATMTFGPLSKGARSLFRRLCDQSRHIFLLMQYLIDKIRDEASSILSLLCGFLT